MQPYRDIDGDSNINSYAAGSDYIRVRFACGAEYFYTYSSAGAGRVERMKALAASGEGLNSYINRKVGRRHARRRALAHNNALPPPPQPLGGFASAELHRYSAG